MGKLFLTLLLIVPIFAVQLLTSEGLGIAGTNIALTNGPSAIIDNPAYASTKGFSFTQENLDLEKTYYNSYEQTLFLLNNFGWGDTVFENSTGIHKIHHTSFSSSLGRHSKWGITLENITLDTGSATHTTWTTNFGMATIIGTRPLTFIGIQLKNFYKETNAPSEIELYPTIKAAYSTNLLPWLMLNNSIEYTRKPGEKIIINTGAKVLFGKNLTALMGTQVTGYTAGIEVPILTGKFVYSMIMPYKTADPIQYSFSYTYGNL